MVAVINHHTFTGLTMPTYYLAVLEVRVPYSLHPPKIKMSAGRILFWRLWRENLFLLILMVGRIQFLGVVGVRSLFSC